MKMLEEQQGKPKKENCTQKSQVQAGRRASAWDCNFSNLWWIQNSYRQGNLENAEQRNNTEQRNNSSSENGGSGAVLGREIGEGVENQSYYQVITR